MAAESAREAYDRYAAVYDETNAQNNYELWLGEVLLPELEKHGLRKDWALDVGCGTGRAFDPLLDRGWQVVGCDVSPGMLAEARRKFGERVRVFESDGRTLPVVSPGDGGPSGEAFSLILLLNDVVNYMTEDGDLEKVFAGVAQNLSRRQGLVAFDANTLALFRHDFAGGPLEQAQEEGWKWEGLTSEARPGGVFEARLSGPGVEPHVHRQRHWPAEQVTEALEASGLRCVAALGQREEGDRILLSGPPDEERDAKVIYVAAHGSPGVMAGRPGPIGPQRGLGKAVRQLREEAKLTPDDLAQRADLSVSQLAKIEAGEDDPVWGDMRRVAAGLEVSMEQLAELAERFEEGKLL